MLRKIVVVGIALFSGSIVYSQGPQAALPDLLLDGPRVQSSVVFQIKNFTRNDCSWVEGSIGGLGKRTLMRFDVSAANIGTADLFLGDPTQRPDLFVYSPCHRHYHFNGYASYDLLDSSGRTLVTGRKQAFCLEDFEIYSLSAGPAKYTCGNQGISVGWADTYGSYLDGQWLDITGVPPGSYQLRVVINPYDVFGKNYPGYNAASALALTESDYSNNTAIVPVTIPAKIK
jgi:hypothetical protein